MEAFKHLSINFVIGMLPKILVINLVYLVSTEDDSTLRTKYGNNKRDFNEIAPCDSQIYCVGGNGTLLHTIQMSRLYNDSKTFVDKPLKYEPNHTIRNFELFMKVSIIHYFHLFIIALCGYYDDLFIIICEHLSKLFQITPF